MAYLKWLKEYRALYSELYGRLPSVAEQETVWQKYLEAPPDGPPPDLGDSASKAEATEEATATAEGDELSGVGSSDHSPSQSPLGSPLGFVTDLLPGATRGIWPLDMPAETKTGDQLAGRLRLQSVSRNGSEKTGDAVALNTAGRPRHLVQPKYMVCIGASAGGLEAIESFVSVLPGNTNAAFIIIQHLSPNFDSMMALILARWSKLEFKQVEDGMWVEASKAYLSRPGFDLILLNGRLLLKPREVNDRGLNLPIDEFLFSLAADNTFKGVGVILSGSGSDGAAGVCALKEAGGHILVQDKTATFGGMPTAAAQTGCADIIAPPAVLARHLVSFLGQCGNPCKALEDTLPPAPAQPFALVDSLDVGVQQANAWDTPRAVRSERTPMSALRSNNSNSDCGGDSDSDTDPQTQRVVTSPSACPDSIRSEALAAWEAVLANQDVGLRVEDSAQEIKQEVAALWNIFSHVKRVCGVDFLDYKPSTVWRRMSVRMKLVQTKTVREYLKIIVSETSEPFMLHKECLIGVTSFFRDTPVWEQLRQLTIDPLLSGAKENSELRCWSPGCSTGEEAYTLAILWREALDENPDVKVKVKIFATDVNKRSVQFGASGVYPFSIAEHVSAERLARFFVRTGAGYKVSRTIRDMIVFAHHDLLLHSPFHNIDLVTCRNLLIYFNVAAQRRVCFVLHFALRNRGFLQLGQSEDMGSVVDRFSSVGAPSLRLFQSKGTRRHLPSQVIRAPPVIPLANNPKEEPSSLINGVFKQLVKTFAPPTVVVDSSGRVLHVCNGAQKLLKIPEGSPKSTQWILVDLLPPEVRMILSLGLWRCKLEGQSVCCPKIHLSETESLALTVTPYQHKVDSEQAFIVHLKMERRNELQIKDAVTDRPCGSPTPSSAAERSQLERENQQVETSEILQALELDLRETKENLQTTIEELQASNEELQASNEELQSTNEELQSTNAELHSMNGEYHRKVAELQALHVDMSNLMAATNIGIIFLDVHLNIRAFTPAIRAVWPNMRVTDLHRPLAELSFPPGFDAVLSECKAVLANDEREREVEVHSPLSPNQDRWFLLRVLANTAHDRVQGLCVTVHEITRRKQAELSSLQTVLTREKETLERTNRIKSEFLANMSQLICTPMNGIIGTLSLLRGEESEGLSLLQREFVTDSVQCAKGLVELVNNILDFSRMDSGMITLAPLPFDLNALVMQVAKQVAKSSHHKDCVFDVFYDPRAPQRVVGDHTRVRQIILNVLSNASRNTHQGSVRTTVEALPDEAGVVICVTDTSDGIPEEDIEQMFRRNATDSALSDSGGSGLGLCIAHQLVELMGGSLSVESVVGCGSAFTIELPLVAEEEVAEQSWLVKYQDMPTFLLPVLVPNVPCADTITSYLEHVGCQALTLPVVDPVTALRVAAEATGERTLCALIPSARSSPELRTAIHSIAEPVVVHSSRSDVVTTLTPRSQKAAKLSAPFSAEMLFQTLAMMLHERGVPVPSAWIEAALVRDVDLPAEYDVDSWAGLKVLMSEDHALNSRVMARILTSLECDVTIAWDGEHLVSKVLCPDPPDIVFMDCHMPKLNGFQATTVVRDIEAQHGIKHPITIIALTSSSVQSDWEQCFKCGMDSFAGKPPKAKAIKAILAQEGVKALETREERVAGYRKAFATPPDLQAAMLHARAASAVSAETSQPPKEMQGSSRVKEFQGASRLERKSAPHLPHFSAQKLRGDGHPLHCISGQSGPAETECATPPYRTGANNRAAWGEFTPVTYDFASTSRDSPWHRDPEPLSEIDPPDLTPLNPVIYTE
eukprot:CAMPEP_0114560152 /NCGR_PEP_ID=MMETSP0114-20121206/11308_1 /TAXON_ID=31324 /ORGANISM="Goniomonas sp, Strain m" /LENGTH=1787 /DNA_ID=CAMNT_0001745681 /DNA_START=172 /DNA_END=5535 /DNA_ORIENTATION=+